MRPPALVRIAALSVFLSGALTSAAGAATFQVDSTADALGDCAVAGQCTLRQALQSANLTAERDVVRVPAGTFDLTGQDLIVTMNDAVDVIGAGAGATTLREVSGGDGRVFLLEQGSSAALSGMTLTGSRDASAILLFGGGVELKASSVVLRGNRAPRGGAIDATGGSVTLEDSTLTANTATERGGAIHLGGPASALTLRNTTVSGNTAPAGSGISVVAGAVDVSFTTLWGNGGAAGELDIAPGASARLSAAILGACSGAAPVSGGGNVAGPGCALGAAGDRAGADPLLGPLQDNGGPTPTHLPAPASPAIDVVPSCPPADQRGQARPLGRACDAGAVEAPADVLAPLVRELSARPARLRSGRRLTIRASLSEPADLVLTVQVARPGRRAGGRCAPPSARTRRAARCVRWVTRRTVRRTGLPAGPVRILLSTRAGISPGRHRARLVATDAAGNRSRVADARFTVVRR